MQFLDIIFDFVDQNVFPDHSLGLVDGDHERTGAGVEKVVFLDGLVEVP